MQDPTPPSGERSWLSRRILVIVALIPAAMLLGLLAWAITHPVAGPSGSGSNTNFASLDLEGREAPGFSVRGLDGDMVQLSDTLGKVVMVDFWASWCPSCRQEAPHLADLYREYQPRGVEFIGVAIWDFPDELAKYVEQFGVTYPNALDERGTVAIDYGVVATPEKFFIDRTGRIVTKFVGPTSPAMVRQQLDALLES